MWKVEILSFDFCCIGGQVALVFNLFSNPHLKNLQCAWDLGELPAQLLPFFPWPPLPS